MAAFRKRSDGIFVPSTPAIIRGGLCDFLGMGGMLMSGGPSKANNPSTAAATPIVSIDGSTDAGWGEQGRLWSLVNGDLTDSAYHGPGGQQADIRIAYNRPKVIDKLGIYPRTDNWTLTGRQPKAFELTATNDGGLSWTSLYTTTTSPQNSTASYAWHYFPNMTAYSLYRWNCTQSWGDGTINFSELTLVEEQATQVLSLIPVLTGGDARVTFSSTYDYNQYPGWKAFDNSTSEAWASANTGTGTPDWLAWNIGSPKLVLEYSIRGRSQDNVTAWQLQGSNDGSNFTTVDSRNVNLGDGGNKFFTVSSPGTYSMYRLWITGKPSGISVITDWRLYGR